MLAISMLFQLRFPPASISIHRTPMEATVSGASNNSTMLQLSRKAGMPFTIFLIICEVTLLVSVVSH